MSGHSKWNNIKHKDFLLFDEESQLTDDSVLTIATADAIINKISYKEAYYKWGNMYPRAGYGGSFRKWLKSRNPQPYNSWGNGSAMRVSPVGFVAKSFDEVLSEAKASAEVTHNHPEGIKGAEATAAAIFRCMGAPASRALLFQHLQPGNLSDGS